SVDYGVFKTGWIIGEDVFVRTPINGNGSWGLSLSLIDVYFRNYGMWDFRFECFDFGNKKQGYDFAGGLSTNLGVLVPIKLKAVSIVPYIKAGPAFHGSEDDVALLVCGYGGLKLGYKFKNTRMTLLLDAHYAYRYMAAGSVQDNFNPHTIEAGIGFAY
ncbi:MAG: hypothetical protein J5808_03595, partial [Paludibacteraceae bacterium]|nr:hypothetical protein [Paludibacteraceae bacterium]